MPDPVSPSELHAAEHQRGDKGLVYAGFWIRTWAGVIDTVLFLIVTAPLLLMIYGSDYYLGYLAEELFPVAGPADVLISYIFPAFVVLAFWHYKSATPGKMIVKVKIVDANTGNSASSRQLIIRYLGYFIAMLPLCLGLIWVALDERKQGWHDKLAGTVVISSKAESRLGA